MTPARTSGPLAWLSRLTAKISGPVHPTITNPSQRMPDLEVWKLPHRQVDMKDWEVAVNMATNIHRPDRSKLLDLYDSLLMDSHLASVMESRVLRVVRSRWRLVGADGKPRADLHPLLEHAWFEDFLRYAAESPFRGHTLIELGELEAPGRLRQVNRIDARNVLPWTGHVVRRQGEEQGYLFREQPLAAYLVEVGRASDLGLLHQVAPVVVIKKFAAGSWSAYVDTYGVPPRWVKSSTTDKARIKQLQEVMRLMISTNYAVVHGDEEIQVMQTPTGDPHKVFDELISRMNSEISKRVLGQDGTSDNKDASGTYGSLRVLQGVAEDRHQADKSLVRHVVQNELLPRLVKLGYTQLQGVRFEWDELRDLSPTELVDAVAKLGAHFEVDPEHVAERTGIKIIGIRRMPGEVSDNPGGAGRQTGKKKRQEEGGEEDEDEDGATSSWPMRELPVCGVCGGHTTAPTASAPLLGQEAMEQLLRDVHGGRSWSQPYFEEVSGVLVNGLLDTWRHGLDQLSYDAPDHVARTMMERNLFRFGRVKTMALATQLNELARESKGLADFRRRVDESGLLPTYSRRYLDTEFANAVNTGMQASRWYQMQASADALPYGEYWTQQDGQVRPAHQALDGKVWPLDHPVWGTIWPPNGWGCRCTVMPTQSGPEESTLKTQTGEALGTLKLSGELDRMKKGGFDTNRAVTGQVFDVNRSYRKELSDRSDLPARLNVQEAYGDQAESMTLAHMMGKGLPRLESSASTPEQARQWYKATSNADGVVVAKDYAGRPIRLMADLVDRKLAKEPGRASLLEHVPAALAAPDEVWVEEPKGDLVFVKFHEGGMLRVPVRVEKGQPLSVRSFYTSTEDSLRSGLLIKRYRQ